ncbi:MAG: hypothetical protein R8P61_04035 [Bacteroidia bacterium]|nr:hypothetical protein [Bacteroidia bacterium]
MRNKLLFTLLFLIGIFVLGILAADPLYHASPLDKSEALSTIIFCIAFFTGVFSFFLYGKSPTALVIWIIAGLIGAAVLNTNATFGYLCGLYLLSVVGVHRLAKSNSAA